MSEQFKGFFKPEDFDDKVGSWMTVDFAVYCNRLLRERGLRVSGKIESEYKSHLFGSGQFATDPSDTHSALLINVQPIARDTPEKLIADLARGLGTCGAYEELIDRAKALRGGK